MTMKKLQLGILAAAALLAAPFAAQAADLPSPSYKAPAYVAPAFSWSGFYVGLNAGYGFGTSDWDNPPISLDPKGLVAGGTVGYNLQTGSWVFGIEGDIDYSGMKDSTACGVGGTCEVRNTWLGTVRGRLGYGGWGSFMPYITGGAAFGNVKASGPAANTSTSETRFGYTIGAGVEYALFSAWSIKGEYLYFNLGSMDCPTCGAAPNEVTFKGSLVRAGVNYRF